MKVAVTKAGLDKMRDELARLKGTEMREHLQALSEAREKGDISENAEYDVARDNINMLSIKITNLEERIRNAVIVVKTAEHTGDVQLFTKVKLLNLKNNKEVTYSIVTEDEADFKLNKISVNSPLAQGLIGHKKEESVKISVPAGLLEFKILEIDPEIF